MEGQVQSPRLLQQVRNVLRLHHYSIPTERSYLDWIKRYVHFHHMRCRQDLADGERKIEAFLTALAVRGKVAASTQNQALEAVEGCPSSAVAPALVPIPPGELLRRTEGLTRPP